MIILFSLLYVDTASAINSCIFNCSPSYVCVAAAVSNCSPSCVDMAAAVNIWIWLFSLLCSRGISCPPICKQMQLSRPEWPHSFANNIILFCQSIQLYPSNPCFQMRSISQIQWITSSKNCDISDYYGHQPLAEYCHAVTAIITIFFNQYHIYVVEREFRII